MSCWPHVGTISVPDKYGPADKLIAAPVFGYGLARSDQINDGDLVIIDTSRQGDDGELRVVVWHDELGTCRAVARVWEEGDGLWLVYPGEGEPVFVPPDKNPFIAGVVVGSLQPFPENN